MPIKLDVKKLLTSRSDRVKCVDVHPTEPWVLCSLYNGHVYIYNYTTEALVKSFEVTDLPVRTAKFVARQQWVISGSDDMCLRVYNYNTMEKLKTIEAHQDYIRCVVVHPTMPYVLSSSDDMLIKLWDWEKGWQNTQVFEGHSHYVMMLAINPKDTNTFASASLDRSIKVWGFGSKEAHFTLEGHDKGVNTVEYFIGGEKPYLITGGDDKLAKVWDYQNKTCVQTLEGHTHNVTTASFHPSIPIIVTGSEDGTVRIWHSDTYRLEKTLNYGLERVWSLGSLKGSNLLAVGYDEGTVVLKLGSEEPAVSMDSSGKIIWAKHNEIQTVNLKAVAEGATFADGERVQLAIKDLGTCEIYPQALQHDPNGRFVVVCGDGEYIIYTALAWRNKTFGSGLEFVWGNETGEYAVRESSTKVKLFKNFKEVKAMKTDFSAEGIFGGTLLGIRSRDFVCLYDWETTRIVRRIEVVPRQIYWSDNNELLAIACESSFYILKFNKNAVANYFATGQPDHDEGIAEAFEVLQEIQEKVLTAHWVGDCFIYTNANNRLNYCVGSEVVTVSHLDREMYLLGYIPGVNRLFLIDKSLSVVSYSLHMAIINYQTAVLRGDQKSAAEILPKIPQEHKNRIAQFLDSQGFKEEALEISTDADHKFELSLQLNRLDLAQKIAQESGSDAEHRWKQLADVALSGAKFDLAEQCLKGCSDLPGLFLLYTSNGDVQGLTKLAKLSYDLGVQNITFLCFLLLNRLEDALDLLCETGRIPEAAFFARSYLPSHLSRVVKLWRQDLQTVNKKAAESLADPAEYGNLFPDIQWALRAESVFGRGSKLNPASAYSQLKEATGRNLLDEIKNIAAKDPSIASREPIFVQEYTSNLFKGGDQKPVSVATPTQTPTPQQQQPKPTPVVQPAPVQQQAAPAPAPAPVKAATPQPQPTPVQQTPAPQPTPVVQPAPVQQQAAPAPAPVKVVTPTPVVQQTPPASPAPAVHVPVQQPQPTPVQQPVQQQQAPAPVQQPAAPSPVPLVAPSTPTQQPQQSSSPFGFSSLPTSTPSQQAAPAPAVQTPAQTPSKAPTNLLDFDDDFGEIDAPAPQTKPAQPQSPAPVVVAAPAPVAQPPAQQAPPKNSFEDDDLAAEIEKQLEEELAKEMNK